MSKGIQKGKLRINIFIKRKSSERPVVFKSDGKRFPQPFTIKLNQDETYEMRLVLQPVFPVEAFLLHEEKIKLEPQKNASKYQDEDSQITYQGEWTPRSFERSARKTRHQLKLCVEFKEFGMILGIIQCKFYPVEETSHSSWGESLAAVQFECDVSPETKSITINKHQLL
ncbi:CB1 cannabinoid receptor-interacting protein 1-like [Paramacrobiotus metropolitanus]|uniref:CB1 cannabinoid receptor-interacting protein 1-like n=1 Tax=Paramacrobiotus metropolitanus TaxID=2943436 RepID=UPI0024459CFB|nr:CB1 cannabinoid receptor-interacting protein 1-like [Paramacrobiotus metropolitanus]